MAGLRTLAAVLGFGSFLVGCFFSFSANPGEQNSGHTLALAGAVIIAGFLISAAVADKGRL